LREKKINRSVSDVVRIHKYYVAEGQFYMQKSVSVNTKVDPVLKEQAESVLNELGMSMATAMTLYLKQIVIHNGLPFDVCLPKNMPIAYEALSEDEFNSLMDSAAKSYSDGKSISIGDFEKQMSKEIGL